MCTVLITSLISSDRSSFFGSGFWIEGLRVLISSITLKCVDSRIRLIGSQNGLNSVAQSLRKHMIQSIMQNHS